MPQYDFVCHTCGKEFEIVTLIADRNNPQPCPDCSATMERQPFRATPKYKPFHNYFDEGLGEYITGRDHRRRVMRTLGMDYRDHMSKGDQSARLDKAHALKKRRLEQRA